MSRPHPMSLPSKRSCLRGKKGEEKMIFKDRLTLVTGGARGIGREIALAFAKEGSDIVICDVNQEALDAAKKEIGSLGRRVETFIVDVTSLSQVEEMVNK